MTVGCTCVSMWFGVLPPPPCPLHGGGSARIIDVSTGASTRPAAHHVAEYKLTDDDVKRIAAAVAERMAKNDTSGAAASSVTLTMQTFANADHDGEG